MLQLGTDIVAICDGVVTFTAFSGAGGYTVTVKNDKYQVSYCHVSPNYLVKVGQTVKQGDVIAQVGPFNVEKGIPGNIYADRNGNPTNGATSGTHLHLTLRVKDESGTYSIKDPLPYITKSSN